MSEHLKMYENISLTLRDTHLQRTAKAIINQNLFCRFQS